METIGNSRETDISTIIRDVIKGLVSDWVFKQIRISLKFDNDKLSVSITDIDSDIPVALMKFILEATELKVELVGFDVKVHVSASEKIEGGEANTIMLLMTNDKVKDGLQKALSGLKPTEEPKVETVPASNVPLTPFTMAIYDAIGYPKSVSE